MEEDTSRKRSAIIVLIVAICMVAVTVPAIIIATQDNTVDVTIENRNKLTTEGLSSVVSKINSDTPFSAKISGNIIIVTVDKSTTCLDFATHIRQILHTYGVNMECDIEFEENDPITKCTDWYLTKGE